MARERGSHRQLGSFLITNLADHNDIRVLPKQGP